MKDQVLHEILTREGWQEHLIDIARSNMKAPDEFGVFCLCERSDSKEMWEAYAATVGFVIAFDTTHSGFESLRNLGKLGKVTYSDEPLGTFLSSYGPEAFFVKRAKYRFECEWRSVRAFHRLERDGEHNGLPVFVAPFNPECVKEVLVRSECSVRQELSQLLAHGDRYRHLRVIPVEKVE